MLLIQKLKEASVGVPNNEMLSLELIASECSLPFLREEWTSA